MVVDVLDLIADNLNAVARVRFWLLMAGAPALLMLHAVGVYQYTVALLAVGYLAVVASVALRPVR